ncbi:hypothetical protein [Pseudomonas sp. CGJS7]|uniref:hypothetical protein n=1 Tax=Pseudomonas sp. CGJS7 TaxID=3109348 RepID=UPI003008ACBE
MKIQTQSLCALVLAVAIAPQALAQADALKQAELQQAATGEAFTLGATQFRLAPSAVVRSDANAAATRLGAAGYVVEIAPRSSGTNTQEAIKAPLGLAAASAEDNLAVAVSASGSAVILKPELNVYFSHIGVVDELVRESGGKLLYSSEIGGKATIGFGSVEQALDARERMLGRAGVKEVAPALLDERQVAW